MRSILRFFVSLFICFDFIIFLVLTTIKFQVLKPDFLVSSLNQPGIYENTEKALRLSLKKILVTNLANQGLNFGKLTVGERVQLDKKIQEITDLISKEKIKDFSENNIDRILAYLNGDNQKLFLYIPIEKWGIPEGLIKKEVYQTYSENTDVEKIIESAKHFPLSKEQFKSLYNYQKTINLYWQISTFSFIGLIILYFLLTSQPSKIHSTSKLLLTLGGTGAVFSYALKILSQNLEKGLPYFTNPIQIFIANLFPSIILSISKLWLLISLTVFFIGFIFISINYLYQKRKENIRNSASNPLA